jgi:predicted transport protein
MTFEAAPTDRAYWEKRVTKAIVALADELLQIAKELDPSLEHKYNKFYIGVSRDGRPFNFVSFHPRKNQLILMINLPETADVSAKIENARIETLAYDRHFGNYQLRLTKDDVKGKANVIRELMNRAYERRAM